MARGKLTSSRVGTGVVEQRDFGASPCREFGPCGVLELAAVLSCNVCSHPAHSLVIYRGSNESSAVGLFYLNPCQCSPLNDGNPEYEGERIGPVKPIGALRLGVP